MVQEAQEKAAALKEEGNAKFKSGEYKAAIEAYTKSLEHDPSQHLCYSNRSAAYLKLGSDSAQQALADAEKCVELAPHWAKGFSRQAAALQELQRWEEASEVCRRGLARAYDESLNKTLQQVQNRRFLADLRGMWNGTVSEELGGYDQEMEFLNDTEVRVEVVGRSIVSRYTVDCSEDPHRLDITVPAENENPPPVPYIARIGEDGLHICCPVMTMARPTLFDGPGYCLMKRGALQGTEDSAKVAKMSLEERQRACVQELIEALPDRRLEELNQTDSEETVRQKMMSQVRFESAMYAISKRFGEDLLKEVLSSATSKGQIPPALKDTAELKLLTQKLKACGIAGEEDPPKPPSSAAERATQKDAQTERKSAYPPSVSAVEETPLGCSGSAATVGVLAAVLAASAVAVLMWRKQQVK